MAATICVLGGKGERRGGEGERGEGGKERLGGAIDGRESRTHQEELPQEFLLHDTHQHICIQVMPWTSCGESQTHGL